MEKFLENRDFAFANLGRILLLGAGESSLASLEYLVDLALDRVQEIVIAAGPKTDSAEAMLGEVEAKSCGKLKIFFDREDVHDAAFGGRFDLCIVSPGISEFSEFVENARKVCDDIISEVEFAFREAPSEIKWIAVTGTNGKTTTVSLITHILKSAGRNAVSVGNIGNVCIHELKIFLSKQGIWAKNSKREDPIFIVEVSSFQLALCKNFAPSISVILNITPDHISWHKTFDNYRDAKLKLFQNFSDMDFAILDCTDPELKKCLSLLKNPEDFKQLSEEDFEKDEICFHIENGHNWGRYSELKIKGEHNKHNALLAALVCFFEDLRDEEVEAGLKSFKALEHRLERVEVVEDITYINDSKATNVEASIQALTAYLPGKMILLYGGKDKGTDLSALAKKSREVCKEVICYGESGPRFYTELSICLPHLHQVETFDEAFDLACELAEPGDYVVLSPACASFDEFFSFEERGEHFKKLVEGLKS